MDEWLMSKKINDAQQFAHLGNLDNVEQSEKKLRD
jgi:soluble cytochrome b562